MATYELDGATKTYDVKSRCNGYGGVGIELTHRYGKRKGEKIFIETYSAEQHQALINEMIADFERIKATPSLQRCNGSTVRAMKPDVVQQILDGTHSDLELVEGHDEFVSLVGATGQEPDYWTRVNKVRLILKNFAS